jgi:hypothetical protein
MFVLGYVFALPVFYVFYPSRIRTCNSHTVVFISADRVHLDGNKHYSKQHELLQMKYNRNFALYDSSFALARLCVHPIFSQYHI